MHRARAPAADQHQPDVLLGQCCKRVHQERHPLVHREAADVEDVEGRGARRRGRRAIAGVRRERKRDSVSASWPSLRNDSRMYSLATKIRCAARYSARLRLRRWLTQGASIGYCRWASVCWRTTWRKCELAEIRLLDCQLPPVAARNCASAAPLNASRCSAAGRRRSAARSNSVFCAQMRDAREPRAIAPAVLVSAPGASASDPPAWSRPGSGSA